MDFSQLYLSREGRLNRKGWWFSIIGLWVIYIIVSLGLSGIFAVFANIVPAIATTNFVNWVSYLLSILFMYLPFFNLAIKRLHDRSRPERLAYYFVLPGLLYGLLTALGITGINTQVALNATEKINFIENGQYASVSITIAVVAVIMFFWALIELGILPGQEGGNEHGPDPSL